MCVHFRYGYILILLEAFLGSLLHGFCTCSRFPSASRLRIFGIRICLNTYYLACTSSSIRSLHLAFSVTPSLNIQYRNFCLLSIDYAFRPRLRSRLTQSGEPSSGNLGFSVRGILTHVPLLTPAFSLLVIRSILLDYASPTLERSPTNSISTIP